MGKTTIISKLQNSQDIQQLAIMFSGDDATRKEIGNAGAEIFLKR